MNFVYNIITNNNQIFKNLITLEFKNEEVEKKFQKEKYLEIKHLVTAITAFISYTLCVYYFKPYFIDTDKYDFVFPVGYNKKQIYNMGFVLASIPILHIVFWSVCLFLKEFKGRILLCQINSIILLTIYKVNIVVYRYYLHVYISDYFEVVAQEKLMNLIHMIWYISIENSYLMHVISEVARLIPNFISKGENLPTSILVFNLIYIPLILVCFYIYEKVFRVSFYNQFKVENEVISMKTLMNDLKIGVVDLNKENFCIVSFNNFARNLRTYFFRRNDDSVRSEMRRIDLNDPINSGIPALINIPDSNDDQGPNTQNIAIFDDRGNIINDANKEEQENQAFQKNLAKFIFESPDLQQQGITSFNDLEPVTNFKYLTSRSLQINEKDSFNFQFFYRYILEENKFQIIFNDVSEISNIEKKKAEKWIKAVYLGKICHEFKNPLITIDELMKILTKAIINKTWDQVLATAKKISSIANFLLILIKDFDDRTTHDSIDKITINKAYFDLKEVTELCKGIFETRCSLSDKSVKIITEIDKGIPSRIYNDSTRLKQVLINLMSNSFKFTTFGEIILRIQKDEKEEEENNNTALVLMGAAYDEKKDINKYSNNTNKLIKKLRIYIKDTGIGIPKDKIDSVAIPYAKFQNVGNEYGAGLGLNISKEIIGKIGGDFKVESEQGQGTKISFFIWICKSLEENNKTHKKNQQNYAKLSNKNSFKFPNNSPGFRSDNQLRDYGNILDYRGIYRFDMNYNKRDNLIENDESHDNSISFLCNPYQDESIRTEPIASIQNPKSGILKKKLKFQPQILELVEMGTNHKQKMDEEIIKDEKKEDKNVYFNSDIDTDIRLLKTSKKDKSSKCLYPPISLNCSIQSNDSANIKDDWDNSIIFQEQIQTVEIGPGKDINSHDINTYIPRKINQPKVNITKVQKYNAKVNFQNLEQSLNREQIDIPVVDEIEDQESKANANLLGDFLGDQLLSQHRNKEDQVLYILAEGSSKQTSLIQQPVVSEQIQLPVVMTQVNNLNEIQISGISLIERSLSLYKIEKTSTFEILVKNLESSPAQIPNSKIHTSGKILKNHINIICIDDESLVRNSEINILKTMLDKKNYSFNILECADGIEALNEIYQGFKKGIKYNYLFTDQNMNFMNGNQTCSIIHSLIQAGVMYKLEMMIVSSYDKNFEAFKNLEGIVTGFLSKPVSKQVLEEILFKKK